MRFHALPETLLRNTTTTRILRVLLDHPAKEFTGRELAETAGTSPPSTIKELNRLYRHGLLDRRRAGPAELWRWRSDHVLTGPLTALFRSEQEAFDELADAISDAMAEVDRVERIVLFGSVARGAEAPDSDVDLLVVVADEQAREAATDRLDQLRVEVATRFGNRLAPVVYTRREYRDKQGTPLVDAAERDGIQLGGRAS